MSVFKHESSIVGGEGISAEEKYGFNFCNFFKFRKLLLGAGGSDGV